MEKVFDNKLLTAFLSNSSLKEYSHIRIGCKANYFFVPQRISDLAEIILQASQAELEILPIGGCSNILFGNVGNRVIISDRYLPKTFYVEGSDVIVSSNYRIMDLIEDLKEHYLGGLEFLAGIPAQLGGAVHMNAGAFDKTISCYVKWVEVIDRKGEKKRIMASEIDFGYRITSISDFIVNICLSLENKSADQIAADRSDILRIRHERHPLEYPSLGSTFRNPKGFYAGLLICDCGLAGKQIGGAQISTKHSNFIINTGNAGFSDVIQLIELIRSTVKEQKGFDLQLEIKVID